MLWARAEPWQVPAKLIFAVIRTSDSPFIDAAYNTAVTHPSPGWQPFRSGTPRFPYSFLI